MRNEMSKSIWWVRVYVFYYDFLLCYIFHLIIILKKEILISRKNISENVTVAYGVVMATWLGMQLLWNFKK